MSNDDVKVISTRAELVALARELGVRADWHEPDEQELTAVPAGDPLNFDNAMPAGHYYGSDNRSELHVVLHKMVWEDDEWRLGKPIAVVNLAMLFAWATGYDERPSRSELDALDALEREQNAIINDVVRRYFTMSDPQDCQLANAIIGELKDQLPRARPMDYEHPHERPCGWEEQARSMHRQLHSIARQLIALSENPWKEK